MNVPNLDVVLLGGQLRSENARWLDRRPKRCLKRYGSTSCFSAQARSAADGAIYSVDSAEASLNRKMLSRSSQSVRPGRFLEVRHDGDLQGCALKQRKADHRCRSVEGLACTADGSSVSRPFLPIRERSLERRSDPRHRWRWHQDDGGACRPQRTYPSHRSGRRCGQRHGQPGLADRTRTAHRAVSPREAPDRMSRQRCPFTERSPISRSCLEETIEQAFPNARTRVLNDVDAAHLGALAGKPAFSSSREPDRWPGPATPRASLLEPAAGATSSATKGAATGLAGWRST
jgi:hypothetical protein